MIIPVSERIRITSDEHQWIVQKARTVKGERCWKSIKYASSFGSAVRMAAEHEIMTCQVCTLKDAILAVNTLTTRYDNLIDDALNELRDHADARLQDQTDA